MHLKNVTKSKHGMGNRVPHTWVLWFEIRHDTVQMLRILPCPSENAMVTPPYNVNLNQPCVLGCCIAGAECEIWGLRLSKREEWGPWREVTAGDVPSSVGWVLPDIMPWWWIFWGKTARVVAFSSWLWGDLFYIAAKSLSLIDSLFW